MKTSKGIIELGEKFSNPVVLVNISLPDQPVIYVNQDFCKLTKYHSDDVLGKNCRFLQGPLTDLVGVSNIKKAILSLYPICQDLVNYNANGEVFYNRLVLIPFKEDHDDFFIGFQNEISVEKFKSTHTQNTLELLDKTLNPLTIMMGLIKNTHSEHLDHLLSASLRIKNYVLSL